MRGVAVTNNMERTRERERTPLTQTIPNQKKRTNPTTTTPTQSAKTGKRRAKKGAARRIKR